MNNSRQNPIVISDGDAEDHNNNYYYSSTKHITKRKIRMATSFSKKRIPSNTTITVVTDITDTPTPTPIDLTKDDKTADSYTKPTFRCAVCLEEPSHHTTTKCGHVFCEGCIKLAIGHGGRCPTCRKKISSKSIHRLFI